MKQEREEAGEAMEYQVRDVAVSELVHVIGYIPPQRLTLAECPKARHEGEISRKD